MESGLRSRWAGVEVSRIHFSGEIFVREADDMKVAQRFSAG
jgi:hypothetical protein